MRRVTGLFAGHADLSMEFTFFLPDALQEQVRNRDGGSDFDDDDNVLMMMMMIVMMMMMIIMC